MIQHDTPRALLLLLHRDLERNHRRLALRRFLMLRALDYRVPLRYRERCELMVVACAPKELQKIQQHVTAWVRMVTRSADDEVQEANDPPEIGVLQTYLFGCIFNAKSSNPPHRT